MKYKHSLCPNFKIFLHRNCEVGRRACWQISILLLEHVSQIGTCVGQILPPNRAQYAYCKQVKP